MKLKEEWERLDPDVKTWLVHNPGGVIVPSAMSARIADVVKEPPELDQHGQIVLSRDDLDFIRDKAEAAGTIRSPPTSGLWSFGSAGT